MLTLPTVQYSGGMSVCMEYWVFAWSTGCLHGVLGCLLGVLGVCMEYLGVCMEYWVSAWSTWVSVCLSTYMSDLNISVKFFSLLFTRPLLGHLKLCPLQCEVPPLFMALGKDALLLLKKTLLGRERGNRGTGKLQGVWYTHLSVH